MIALDWITPGADPERYAAARRLRWEVLRRPLGMPLGSELNAAEARLEHCVAIDDGQVIGCVLWLEDADHRGGKLLQMAVAESHRGQDVGRRLVRELERAVAARGVTRVYMHARESALGFYRKLGYAEEGETFSEVGIPHRLMRRLLT